MCYDDCCQVGLGVLMKAAEVFSCNEANDNANALQMVAAIFKAGYTIESLAAFQLASAGQLSLSSAHPQAHAFLLNLCGSRPGKAR